MPNIEFNSLITELNDSDLQLALQGLNGRTITDANRLRSLVKKVRGSNQVLIRSTQDLIDNFAINGSGEYNIPDGTCLYLPCEAVSCDRPLNALGGMAIIGNADGNKLSIFAQTFDGILIKGTNFNFFHTDHVIFSPISMFAPVPAPNTNCQLFDIQNTTVQPQSYIVFCVMQGYGSLGTIYKFDFLFVREIQTQYNLEGLDIQANIYNNAGHINQYGLANGIVHTINNTPSFSLINQQYRLGPSEYAFNFIDNPSLVRGKVVAGVLEGTPSQGFKPGSLTQTHPRISVSNMAPLAPSDVYISYSMPSSTETPLVANNFYPFTAQLTYSGAGAERFEIQGTGNSARLVYIGKEKINIPFRQNSSMKAGTGSPSFKIALGKNLGNSQGGSTFNDAIPTSDTTNWNALNGTGLVGDGTVPNGFVSQTIFTMEENDYIKPYFSSTTTANITHNGSLGLGKS